MGGWVIGVVLPLAPYFQRRQTLIEMMADRQDSLPPGGMVRWGPTAAIGSGALASG